MIDITCENCGKQFQAPEEKQGKRGKCPVCGYRNPIPSSVVSEATRIKPIYPYGPIPSADVSKATPTRSLFDYLIGQDELKGKLISKIAVARKKNARYPTSSFVRRPHRARGLLQLSLLMPWG